MCGWGGLPVGLPYIDSVYLLDVSFPDVSLVFDLLSLYNYDTQTIYLFITCVLYMCFV